MDTATLSSSCPTCGDAQPLTHRFCQRCGTPLGEVTPSPAPPPTDGVETEQSLLEHIRAELDELKDMASAFGIGRMRDGSWFNTFLHAMLATYASKIIAGGGSAFFHAKYVGLTRDQIADKLCELATRYAALAGGTSGAAASAAFAATIATAGGASVVTVPAGVAAVMAEILYTTRLQVRLIYDLSHVYGFPIDLDDPEDLYRAFCMAYGVAFVSGNVGATVKVLTPEIARAQLRGLIHGHTTAIQQVAMRLVGPKIGKQITQKAILRTAVPVVGIGIAATWNYVSTSNIASAARHGLRAVARLRAAVDRLGDTLRASPEHAPLVVECVLTVMGADGIFDQHEHEVFQAVIKHLNVPTTFIEQLEQRIDIDSYSVEQRLHAISDPALRAAFVSCIELIAVADGSVAEAEVALLQRLLPALGHALDLKRLHEQAILFQQPPSWMQQAKGTLGTVGASVSSTVSGWFTKRKRTSEADVQPEPSESASPAELLLERMRTLVALHAEGLLTDLEFTTKQQALLAQI